MNCLALQFTKDYTPHMDTLAMSTETTEISMTKEAVRGLPAHVHLSLAPVLQGRASTIALGTYSRIHCVQYIRAMVDCCL